jgi:two-component system, OmpR family, response regulator VicR
MRILICDDDIMTLKAVEYHLKNNGFEVDTARDGRSAALIFDKDKHNLVLLDIHMPYINGLELITYIRKSKGCNVPIVMLTRVGMEEIIQEAYDLGANDYITKPFNPEELTIRLKRLLIHNEKT